jgi:hypothetical protein
MQKLKPSINGEQKDIKETLKEFADWHGRHEVLNFSMRENSKKSLNLVKKL